MGGKEILQTYASRLSIANEVGKPADRAVRGNVTKALKDSITSQSSMGAGVANSPLARFRGRVGLLWTAWMPNLHLSRTVLSNAGWNALRGGADGADALWRR